MKTSDLDRLVELAERIIVWRGGPTSGNWAHSGRQGKKGGSGSGGGFRRIGVKSGKKSGRKGIKRASRQTRAKDERGKSSISGSAKISVKSGEKPNDTILNVDKKAKDWFLSKEEPSFNHPRFSLGGYTITQTRSVAAKNVDALSKDSGLSKKDTENLIIDWAQSPFDDKKEGHIKLQQAALKKFNIKKDARQELPYEADEKAIKLLDSSYKLTQEEFKKRGVKELTLYRGMSNAKNGKYNANALDSWTLDPKVAQGYASLAPGENRGVMKMKVPIERIVGTAFTGLGTLDNSEFVVAGGENAGTVEIASAN